eukprot:1114716-Karenia_brevis.AAC.1
MSDKLMAAMEERNNATKDALANAMSVQLKLETNETVRKIGLVVDQEVSRIDAKLAEHDVQIKQLQAACVQSQREVAELKRRCD